MKKTKNVKCESKIESNYSDEQVSWRLWKTDFNLLCISIAIDIPYRSLYIRIMNIHPIKRVGNDIW